MGKNKKVIEEENKELKEKKSSKKYIILLLGIIIFFVLGFLGGFLFEDKLNDNKNTTTEQAKENDNTNSQDSDDNADNKNSDDELRVNTEDKNNLLEKLDETIEQNKDNDEVSSKLKDYKEKLNLIEDNEGFIELKKEVETFIGTIENKAENNDSEDKSNSNTEPDKDNNSSTGGNTSTGSNTKPSSGSTGGSSTSKTKSSLESSLNSVSLKPLKTGYSAVDNKVEKIISSQTNSSMSTYQKVKALYDWVINVMDYSIPVVNNEKINNVMNESGVSYNDAFEIYLAQYGFDGHTGSCDVYSAMFMILTRRLGLDSYTVTAKNTDGSGHTTVNIKIGGVWYDFDTQGEDNTKKNGKIQYIFFGKKDSEIKKIYTYPHRDKDVSEFNMFKRQSDKLTAKITIGNKSVSADSYSRSDKYVSEYIEVEMDKIGPVDVKVESNYEVSYCWNTFTVGNKYPYLLPSEYKGKIKSGTIKLDGVVFGSPMRSPLNLMLKDEKGRIIIFLLKLNVKLKGGEFKIATGATIYPNYVLITGSAINGVGDVTFTAKVTETNDPKGISAVKIEKDKANSFKVSNIDKTSYYYVVEVTGKDAAGKVATGTFKLEK